VRRIVQVLVGAALSAGAMAQTAWKPEKNVEIVAGVAAGGNMDRTARAMQAIMQQQKLIPTTSTVVNKPGGGQALGLQYVKSHEGDPHYLSVNSEPLVTNRVSGRSPIAYTDFTPIAHLFDEYIVYVVRADSPLKSVADLAARLKNDPASLNTAVGAALGNVNHIALALLAKQVQGDVRKVRIPVFNSTGESVTALLGGHVDLIVATVASIVGQAASGKVRMLAVTSAQRLPGVMANVPTLRESGYDVTFSSFRVVLAPKGLSAAQVAYWDGVMSKIVNTEEWKTDMERFYWVMHYLNSGDTGRLLRDKDAELRGVYADIGLAR
jgi:putative tricarboxylic transport membrane protein